MRLSCLVSLTQPISISGNIAKTPLLAGVAGTLTRALASPASVKAPVPTGLLGKQEMISAAGRYEGALLGLGAMGKQTVAHALLANGAESLRILGGEVDKLSQPEKQGVIDTALVSWSISDTGREETDQLYYQTALEKLADKSSTNDITTAVGATFASAISKHDTLASAISRHLSKD
jgi:hypothetical protein